MTRGREFVPSANLQELEVSAWRLKRLKDMYMRGCVRGHDI